MQNQISPLILTFGASDPVSGIGIQADLASFAAMGCHGLPVITAILVGDTSQIDDVHPMEADLVVDQARTILEDMPVVAFKVGQIASVENVTVIAEIVSDYPALPLVLDPFNSGMPDDPEAEDLLLAIRELLIPQATVLLISAVELSRLAETWREPNEVSESDESGNSNTETNIDDEMLADVMTLIESGCEYVFVTGTPTTTNEVANILFNEAGVVRNDRWQRITGSHVGAGTTLSASIAALLANGLEIPEAVLEAQEFTLAAISHAQRLGMGRLIPDRYFWAKEPE
ncbi:hydroxymethylpyrimidine/phosphomethylpyrimidine kinase [Undibacterium sp. 5I1]|uniref:bifunctional hydroxymethylpyrimidine kinase/phosphomethylpyrimidine kinase n=1 Tax=unclassified Undibacterium TaxID=2630295 RepID=UPI002AB3E93B|nr:MULTISPECIES: hydroxymethylpyrimidine/phosphomethylpyrimidine kinase [unclassified Undibacterium]MDY7540484.1 hydroxymethylpyrimidine/phosphomethylpyrimidine kinase [Undibacterium sp. 5I1]MEB0230055.1 hydroxymethylpyrimidine/phosphomethylpyrimidine kinase [Undibacterium sp. 10I3]MEB0257743.1 hydroxymethylpyrimidine/phosphomethylpyrimidine kinase [Undibacterium sp. 5I1]